MSTPNTTDRVYLKYKRRWMAPLIIVCGVCIVSLLLFRSLFGQSAPGKSNRKTDQPGIPVVAASARSADLNIYQSELGTVVPLKIVTVRSRVDGQLTRIEYQEGQTVREGDLLALIDPRPYEVQMHLAEGQLAKDQAVLVNAKVDLKRYEELIKDDSISRQQLDTQQALVNQYEAVLKSDQAQVEGAKLNLMYCHITAPISGTVGLRLVDPGNMVHANDATGLVVITQLQPITAIFSIATDYLPQVLARVRAGDKPIVEAWDRSVKSKLALGSLLAVDNQIDASTGMIRMRAIFPNTNGALYPNQFINAKLLVDTLKSAVIVPSAAIQRSPQFTYVFVVSKDMKVEIRQIEVQLSQGDDTAIRKGISIGEIVVIDGVDKLQSGSKVTLIDGKGPGKGKTT